MTKAAKKKPTLSAAQRRKQAERRKPKKPEPSRQPHEANSLATSSDNPGGPSWHRALRTAAAFWRQAIPREAVSSGYYQMPAGGPEYTGVPDGLYRLDGDDWLMKFEGGRFVEANRAQAPHWGGPDVVHVPNS